MDLDDLVSRWRSPIAGYCAVRGLGREAADRVAHDVFVEAWLGRDRFAGDWNDPAAVGPWMRGIARNVLRTAMRARARTEPLAVEPAAPETVVDSSESADLRAVVRRLPPHEREVVWAFYFDEVRTRDVAAFLGITEKAVENRLRRARGRLREMLSGRLGRAGEEAVR